MDNFETDVQRCPLWSSVQCDPVTQSIMVKTKANGIWPAWTCHPSWPVGPDRAGKQPLGTRTAEEQQLRERRARGHNWATAAIGACKLCQIAPSTGARAREAAAATPQPKPSPASTPTTEHRMQQSTGAATSSAADSGMGATDLVSRCGGDGGGGGGNSCSGGSSDPAAINTTISSKQADAREPQEEQVAIHYLASFHELCVVTALLPLVTLFTCFVTAYVFQYDDVHETHCRVYNIIPSISAITGVSPQRYFWRFSIALHIGPRIPIAFVYKNYYRSQLRRISPAQVPQTSLLITLILVLNCIEIASLGGVTYISNRENYPVHERIFITFMVCSLCYMLATIKLNSILNAGQALSEKQLLSIKWKKILFAVSILSTVGLLVFFAKHRFYCHDLAFSWFAFFEYLIAIANMLFHFTIIWDFPSQFMMIVQGPRENLAQYLSNRPKLD